MNEEHGRPNTIATSRLLHTAFLAFLFVAALYVFWDADRPFNQTDEFLYSGVVLEMLDSGDFVTPRFGPIELLTKPPLFYWLSLPPMVVFEAPEVAMRLLPGLSLLATMTLVFLIARRQWSPMTGLVAAVVFFLCYDHLHNHVYRSGVMEGLLNLQFALVFWLNLQLRERPGRIRWISALLALALMTKFAFVVIPGAITAANLWLNRHEYRIPRRLVVQSIAVFLAIALPWFVLLLHVHGLAAVDYMFVDQVLKRAINDTSAAASTGRSFGRSETLYVLRHYLEYGQPWSILIWPALFFAVRHLRVATRQEALLLALCIGWFVGVMVLFLLSRGRWSWYISSIYAPSALLIAVTLREFMRNRADAVAPWLWACAGASFIVAQSPFMFNPYASSSGAFPLYGNPVTQIAAGVAMALAAALLTRRTAGWPGDQRLATVRANGVLALATLATMMLIATSLWPSVPYTLSFVSGPVALAVCLGVLALVPLRRHKISRIVCVVCPMLAAVGYVVAPLGWAGHDNRRWEIKRVDRAIAAGHFDANQTLSLRPMSLFSFIPIYATFKDDFGVTYDADDRKVTLTRLESDGD